MLNTRSKSSFPNNNARKHKIIHDDEEDGNRENISYLSNLKPKADITRAEIKTTSNAKSNSSQDKTRPSSVASSIRKNSTRESLELPKPVKKPQIKKKEIIRTDFKIRRKFPFDGAESSDVRPSKRVQTRANKKIYIASVKFTDEISGQVIAFPLFKDSDVLSKRAFDKHLIPQDLDNDVNTDEDMMSDALAHSKKNLQEGIKEKKTATNKPNRRNK
jgi:hypothetical protein